MNLFVLHKHVKTVENNDGTWRKVGKTECTNNYFTQFPTFIESETHRSFAVGMYSNVNRLLH